MFKNYLNKENFCLVYHNSDALANQSVVINHLHYLHDCVSQLFLILHCENCPARFEVISDIKNIGAELNTISVDVFGNFCAPF
jgi:hypothetical protein